MKRFVLACILLVGATIVLQALEVPVSIDMAEKQPYQREFRYEVVKAVSGIEGVKIVEPGQGEWFRVQVLIFQMKLENQTPVGYSIGYSIIEVPFYLHSFILENLDPAKSTEDMQRLIKSLVFFHGSNLVTVGKNAMEFGASQISSSLSRIIEKRTKARKP